MKSLKNRLKRLENRNGFDSDKERMEYVKYAKKIDPEISKDDIRTPEDYLNLLHNHLDPLPHEEL